MKRIWKQSVWIILIFFVISVIVSLYRYGTRSRATFISTAMGDQPTEAPSLKDTYKYTSTELQINLVTFYHSITVFTRVDNHSVNSFEASFLQRVSEELFVLQKNLDHPLIAKVHILAEDEDRLVDFFMKNKINLQKIVVHSNGKVATMRDIFQYISENLVNKTAIFANGDIYLGDGFDRVNTTIMRDQRIMYALTRHHAPERNCSEEFMCNKPYVGSHDTFMIHLTEPIPHTFLEELEYEMSFWGSENRLMWLFRDKMDFCVLNPCNILQTFHYHCSGFRNNRTRVNLNEKSALAAPTEDMTCSTWKLYHYIVSCILIFAVIVTVAFIIRVVYRC